MSYTFKMLDRKNGNAICKITCYDKKAFETLYKKMKRLPKINVVIVDET